MSEQPDNKPQEEGTPTQQKTMSQVLYDWYELYLTPLSGY